MSRAEQSSIFETPASKSFQFNGHSDGSVGQDVNQFQGAVSFSVPLVSLAGRSGLNIEVSAVYNSTISGVVGRSNLDATTGILGLGWDLLIDHIDADYSTPGNRDSATFYLTRRGTRNRLYWSDRPWQRGLLEASFVTTLDQGVLSTELLTAFLQQSLVVDPSAKIDILTASQQWKITDSVNEYVLLIVPDSENPQSLLVLDGGIGYELESFDFSRVRYYAEFERWEVFAPNGMCCIFGGGIGTGDDGNHTSRGESIVWGLKWNNWAGTSIVAKNSEGENLQTQYPLSWYVSSERAINRDEIHYTYQQVKQKVGTGYLVYTKAIYPSTIVDMFGRTAMFAYEKKEFNDAPDQPREYLDPYKSHPDNQPDAYQSRYETLYLASITCRNENDELLLSTHLEYEVRLFSAIPNNAPPTFAGDRYKRVLTSIAKYDDQGVGLPPLLFTYNNINQINPGAIATKVLPEGATVLYAYQQKSLSACARSLTITPAVSSASPKIWFGSDYVVVMWMAADRFSITVYTWSGRWIPWQPSDKVYHFSGNPDDITTDFQNDYFVMSVGSANNEQSTVLFFHKNNRILGGWLESPDSPLMLNTADRNIAAGDRFFAVANNHDNTVDRYTWNNTQKQWDQLAYPTPPEAKNPSEFYILLAAASNILLVFYFDRLSSPGDKKSLIILNYLDEKGEWHEGSRRIAPEITAIGSSTAELKKNLQWSASSWVFAATSVTQESNSNLQYQITLYTWGSNNAPSYSLNSPFQLNCSMEKAVEGSIPYNPKAAVKSTGLVTSGPYLLRFNGLEWLVNDNLKLRLPVTESTAFWFAQGEDIVIKTENSENLVLGMVQVFDPNKETNAWTEAPISLYDNPPGKSRLSSYFPTAGTDFISFNDTFYYRGTSSDWIKPIQNPIQALPPGSNTTTLINEAPEFMVYLQEHEGMPVQTNMLLLNSGFIGATESVFQSFYRAIDPDGKMDPHTIGKLPAGPGTFATFLPLDASFDQAQSITLYRFLNNSIIEQVTDFPVRSVTVHDGYQSKRYEYSFDAVTAAVNPQGYSYKYYHSMVQIGDGSISGSTQFTFINGVGGALPGNPVQDAVLDGQLARKELYDAAGMLVSSQENTWQVVDRIQDPVSGQQHLLNGVFVQLAKTVNTINGIENIQIFSYDPSVGQLISTETKVWNALGKQETRVKSVDLGYAAYPLLYYLNMLEQQVGSSSTVAVGDDPAVVTAQKRVLYKSFDGLPMGEAGNLQMFCPWQSHARRKPGNGSVESNPEEWLMQKQVNKCNPYGYPTETIDASGLVISRLYAEKHSPAVATFSGASIVGQEAYYYGFEPYESSGRWELDEQVTPIVTSISKTGTRCLSLPSGITGTALTLTPRDRSQPFIFGFWGILDPAVASPSPATAWRIEFSSSQASDQLPEAKTIDVKSTEWEYYSISIDLSDIVDTVTIRITPVNTGKCTIFVDNVCFSTLMGGSTVKVYNPRNFLLTAEAGPHNEISYRIYDRAHRQIASTSEFQAVVNVIAPYLSRQNHSSFNSADPNSQLVFQPMGQTCYERFRNNGAWANHFTSPQPGQWQSSDGKLSYTGEAGGEISVALPGFRENYACRFDLLADASSPEKTGFTIGPEIKVYWDPADQKWHLDDTLNTVTLESEVSAITPAGDWMIIFSTDAIIFALDGVIIFDYLPENMPSGGLTLTADCPISMRDFLIGAQPQVAINYFDGSSKSLQGQSIEGAQAVVAAVIHDAAARPVIQVKPVVYEGTKGANGTLVLLRTDVVTDLDWNTGVLSGKASTDNPEDEGYPYIRKLLENSPLERVLQKGAPGKQFAITGEDPSTLHTIRYTYDKNTNAAINSALGLPEGCYHCITTTDQDGRISVAISNAIGHPVGTATLLDEASQEWLLNLQFTAFTSEDSQRTVRLPNYYAPPAGSEASAWVNVTQRNLLGSISSSITPDAGTMNVIADNVGQTRFTQNPMAAQLGLIMYAKYDRYGRTLEAGLVPGTWDAELLVQRANTPDWPTAKDGARAIRRYEYGSDVTKVNNIGRLVRTFNFDEISGQPVTSNMNDYDDNGKIQTNSLHIEETDTLYTTRYTYDNLGNSAGTVYASGYTVQVERDSVGRVKRIIDGDGKVLAEYRYRPDDQVQEQTILPGSANELKTGYSYASPGWLKQITSDFMTETLSYTTGSYTGTPYYSGRLGAVKTEFKNLASPDPDFVEKLSYAYDYDARGQLRVAQALIDSAPKPEWSFGLQKPATYDPNGNFRTVSDGETDEDYKYTPNTNQVINTTGGDQADFTSNSIGAITQAVPKGITGIDYKLLSQQAGSIQTGSNGSLRFEYDSHSNRIQKITETVTRTYVRGLNGWPLLELSETSGNGASDTTEYLYGAQGIFAIRQNGIILPVLTDHLKSLRALIGPDNKVQIVFHYSPFGKVVSQYGDASELRYRFTGYEYDSETGLYCAATRLYDPQLKRFYSVDPQMQFYSPYVYAGNNPISVLDPTGEASWWAELVGALVGIVVGVIGIAATIATGGALAPEATVAEMAAVTAVDAGITAVAGAASTVAGDATTAGLSGEKFTAKRALIDVVGGAVGGAAGTLVGGPAAALAMKGALSVSEDISVKAVTTIGSITAGVVGGATGAAAQGGVTAAMTGQSFFSNGTALSIAIGGAAGFGGSLLGSGAYMGWSGDTMPVPLGREDFPLIRQNMFQGENGGNSLTSFNHARAVYAGTEDMYHLNPTNGARHDVINMHGSPGRVYVTINKPNFSYERPLSPKLLAEFLTNEPGLRLRNNAGSIKLAICYGGKGTLFYKPVGRTLSTALGREVWGAKGVTYSPSGSPDHQWVRFT